MHPSPGVALGNWAICIFYLLIQFLFSSTEHLLLKHQETQFIFKLMDSQNNKALTHEHSLIPPPAPNKLLKTKGKVSRRWEGFALQTSIPSRDLASQWREVSGLSQQRMSTNQD